MIGEQLEEWLSERPLHDCDGSFRVVQFDVDPVSVLEAHGGAALQMAQRRDHRLLIEVCLILHLC